METGEQKDLPPPPSSFNLGSNQEMVFIRRSSEDFILICSIDSHAVFCYVSAENKWRKLDWRDVRNGSAHIVFDPVTSAFYYKIDGERFWWTAPVKME